jgi:hypothetical protein
MADNNILAASKNWKSPFTMGQKAVHLPLRFTTDGSSDVATGASQYGGHVTVTRGTDSGETDFYLITLPGDWGTTRAVIADTGNNAATYDKVVDSVAGTVELQFSDPLVSATIDVVIFLTATNLST